MKTSKIISIILFFTICLFILSFIPTFASASARIDTGISVGTSANSEFDGVGRVILGAIQGIGIGISVVVLVVIGIKFMLGSAEERAEYKSSMVPYLIGVAFLAGATSIPSMIYNVVPK